MPDAEPRPESTTGASEETFEPPYLFAPGGQPADRPIIGAALPVMRYGVDYRVVISSSSPVPAWYIGKVTLLRLGSVTHGFDQDQRFLSLSFSYDWAAIPPSPYLTVTPPAGPSLAPPGYYMLFVISNDGVPSAAKYVRLEEAVP